MAQAVDSRVSTYELPLAADEERLPDERDSGSSKPLALPGALLVQNELWFCRLRWVAITILLALGVLGFAPPAFGHTGLRVRAIWPFIAAGVLTLANVGFISHAHLLNHIYQRLLSEDYMQNTISELLRNL